MNVVVLQGELSRPAERRELPSGDTVVALEVTVRTPGVPAESVPVAWPDAPGWVDELEPGTAVVVSGRVRRRFFRSGGATASRTEVVATQVLRATERKKVERLLAAAVAGLQA